MSPFFQSFKRLVLVELLDSLASSGQDAEDVESDGLGERSALTDGDGVTFLDTECGADVCGEVLVSLLVSGVLGDEVEVLSADDDGTVHLGGDDLAGQDTATDGDETGEGALLVCRVESVSAVLYGCRMRCMLQVVCILDSRLPPRTFMRNF